MIELKKSHKDFSGMRFCTRILDRNATDSSSVVKVEPGRVIATDGHRLHSYVLQEKVEDGLYSVLKGNASVLQLELSKDQSLRYPDSDQIEYVLLREPGFVAYMERKELLRGLKQMAILRTSSYRGMNMWFSGSILRLSIVNPDLGDAETDIEIEYKGVDLDIGINVGYMLDVIGFMKSSIVALGIVDANTQVVIAGKEDKGFLGLIMPMRL